jgi:hypothetical protein
MSDRKPTCVVLPAIVVLAVVLVAYAGAYYAMVGAAWPHRYSGGLVPFYEIPGSLGESLGQEMSIRIGSICRCAFAPMHGSTAAAARTSGSRSRERGAESEAYGRRSWVSCTLRRSPSEALADPCTSIGILPGSNPHNPQSRTNSTALTKSDAGRI